MCGRPISLLCKLKSFRLIFFSFVGIFVCAMQRHKELFCQSTKMNAKVCASLFLCYVIITFHSFRCSLSRPLRRIKCIRQTISLLNESLRNEIHSVRRQKLWFLGMKQFIHGIEQPIAIWQFGE